MSSAAQERLFETPIFPEDLEGEIERSLTDEEAIMLKRLLRVEPGDLYHERMLAHFCDFVAGKVVAGSDRSRSLEAAELALAFGRAGAADEWPIDMAPAYWVANCMDEWIADRGTLPYFNGNLSPRDYLLTAPGWQPHIETQTIEGFDG